MCVSDSLKEKGVKKELVPLPDVVSSKVKRAFPQSMFFAVFFKGTERDPEGVKNESIQNEVHPSGRTVRLSCRPGDGIEPEVRMLKVAAIRL